MFVNCPQMTSEDKANIALGYLPDVKHILSIIPATGFFASYKDKKNPDEFALVPLVAWALLKNGSIFPLLYKHDDRSFFIAFAIDDFIEITHERFIEDEDEDEDEGEGDIFKTI